MCSEIWNRPVKNKGNNIYHGPNRHKRQIVLVPLFDTEQVSQMFISTLSVRDHVKLSIVYLQSAINVFVKLKHSGLSEKGFDDIFQAIVVLHVS